jgi:NAD(P)H-dependent FMN reductase
MAHKILREESVGKKVVAVLGTYRKGGALNAAVEAILEGARARRATTTTVYLTDKHIEFCTNCRNCTQVPGPERGRCLQNDDLDAIVKEIEVADAVVLASPVNCGNATAIFRRFMERLIGCAYWPWEQAAPKARTPVRTLKAALVATSAMPGFLIPIATGTRTALRTAANILGAKPVASLWIGLSAGEPDHRPSERVLARARRIGMRLV